MAETRTVMLGDIARFRYGKMPESERVLSEDDMGGFPIFTGYRIAGRYPEFNIEKPKLIIVCRGVGGTGDVKISPSKCWLTNLAIEFDFRDESADIRYLYYFFSAYSLRFLDTGSAQSQITITDLQRLKIPLPEITIQKKIAAILSAYDDLIENNRRRIALLEKMAEEIYREWFVRMRFPGHEQAKFEKGVPEGWRVERVASLVDRKRFGRIYRESELLPEGAVVVIDQSTNEWLGFHEGKAEHEASPERPLILFGDHSCKMQLMIEPFSLAENVIPFSSKGEMPIIFLYYLVHSLVETTEYKRHWADLTTKQVFVPADTLQKQFDEKVKNLIVMSRQLKAVNAMLSKVRDQLLPRLISGKLLVEKLNIQFPPSMLNEPSPQPSATAPGVALPPASMPSSSGVRG